ncbi:hypothetical protein J3A83DRAFT_4374576 [Scleroderma citrinum]
MSMTSGPASLTGSNGMAGSHQHYMNEDLPAKLQENRRWTKQILPTLLTWAGSLSDPWMIQNNDLMLALQAIVTTVILTFQDLTAIHPGLPIFMLAAQQLTFWCSNFGSTAIVLVTHFLAFGPGDAQSTNDVQQTCKELMDRPLAFLYQDLDVSDPKKAYWSNFILHLLAHAHL